MIIKTQITIMLGNRERNKDKNNNRKRGIL